MVLFAHGNVFTVEWTYAVVNRYHMPIWSWPWLVCTGLLRQFGGSLRICCVAAVLHGLAGAPTLECVRSPWSLLSSHQKSRVACQTLISCKVHGLALSINTHVGQRLVGLRCIHRWRDGARARCGPDMCVLSGECVPGREKRQSRFLSGTCLRECNPTLVRLATYVPADSGTGSRNFHHTDVTESENVNTDVDAPNRDEQRV